MPSNANRKAAPSRLWLVVSEQTTRRYFRGIRASSSEEAIAKWEAGEGELDQELTETLPWKQRAEEVRRA